MHRKRKTSSAKQRMAYNALNNALHACDITSSTMSRQLLLLARAVVVVVVAWR
jgi:hypothetical protein